MPSPCKVCAVFALAAGVVLVSLSWLWYPEHFIENGWGGGLAFWIGIAYFAPRLWGAVAFLGATHSDVGEMEQGLRRFARHVPRCRWPRQIVSVVRIIWCNLAHMVAFRTHQA